MEWYGYVIIIGGLLLFLMMIAFFISRKFIKLGLNAFFQKGKVSLVFEMMKNRNFMIHVKKIDDDKIQIGKKTYPVSKEDIGYLPQLSLTGVVVSENVTSSLNPKSTEQTVSPTALDSVIKRIKMASMPHYFNKLMLIFGVALGIAVLAVIFNTVVTVMLVQAAETAGIVISF